MQGFITIFLTVWQFMVDTPIMTLHIGEFTGQITFMQLLIGTAIAVLGVQVVHKIMEW